MPALGVSVGAHVCGIKISVPHSPIAVVGELLVIETRDRYHRTRLGELDKSSGHVQIAWSNRSPARSKKTFPPQTPGNAMHAVAGRHVQHGENEFSTL